MACPLYWCFIVYLWHYCFENSKHSQSIMIAFLADTLLRIKLELNSQNRPTKQQRLRSMNKDAYYYYYYYYFYIYYIYIYNDSINQL